MEVCDDTAEPTLKIIAGNFLPGTLGSNRFPFNVYRPLLNETGIHYDKKVNEWNDEEQTAIRNIINNEFKTEGALRSEVQMNIKRLLDIACYRGLRHRKGLPLRGQRTRTNSRTRKGKRKTVAGKKKVAKK